MKIWCPTAQFFCIENFYIKSKIRACFRGSFEQVFWYRHQIGFSTHCGLNIEKSKGIEDCISNDVLKDFLIEQRSEVLEMVLYSFDKELYEKDLKQIAFEEGEQAGKQIKLREQVQKKLSKGKSIEDIADDLEESVDVIKEIIVHLE